MNPILLTGRVLAVCAVALTAGSCAKEQPQAKRPPPRVKTAISLQTNVPVVVSAFGTATESVGVDIVPRVSGVLLQTYIEDGAVVTNGQPLFQIDASDYSNRVRQAEGNVAVDRSDLELALITLERNRSLHEKELISSEDFDVLKQRMAAAEARLRSDEAVLEQAVLDLERCTIVSPVSGICSPRDVDNGNLVTAGATRLVNIRRSDPIYLDFSASEQDLPLIRSALAGGSVTLDIRPRGDTNVYHGTLQSIANAVNTETGTIHMRGLAPNPALALWAGQFVDIAVRAGVVSNAVMVPEGAVQFGKQGAFLFAVSTNSTADLRQVNTGVRADGMVQVLGQVNPGEKVVVLGQLMLHPGASLQEAADTLPATTHQP